MKRSISIQTPRTSRLSKKLHTPSRELVVIPKSLNRSVLSSHEWSQADSIRAPDQSDPQRVIRTLSETNHSLLVESELLEALVLSTIVKRSYLLEPDLGVGSIMVNPLLGLEAVLREVSFFPKPTNSLDPFCLIRCIVCIGIP